MKEENSYTGKYLKIHLDREEERKKKIKSKIKQKKQKINVINIIIM